jgi:hypothetical protein
LHESTNLSAAGGINLLCNRALAMHQNGDQSSGLTIARFNVFSDLIHSCHVLCSPSLESVQWKVPADQNDGVKARFQAHPSLHKSALPG